MRDAQSSTPPMHYSLITTLIAAGHASGDVAFLPRIFTRALITVSTHRVVQGTYSVKVMTSDINYLLPIHEAYKPEALIRGMAIWTLDSNNVYRISSTMNVE